MQEAEYLLKAMEAGNMHPVIVEKFHEACRAEAASNGSTGEDEPVNIRELHIDLDKSFERPVIDSWSQTMVRPTGITWEFEVVLWINGWRVARHRFAAHFTAADFEDEKRMTEKIIEQLKYRSRPEIWDARYRIVGDKWEDRIKFSPAAKEAIDFLTRYAPRLIEAFTNQLPARP